MTRVTMLACLLTALVPGMAATTAAQSTPSMPELIRDTQKQVDDPRRLTLAWWLPEEFWRVSAQQNGAAGPQMEEMIKLLQPYLVMAVVDGKVGPMGGVEFRPSAEVRAAVKLRDSGGKTYAPLPEDELGGDVKNLVTVLRSLFANMLGSMGAGIEIFFFPAKSAQGALIASATKEGAFSVLLGSEALTWRLPLASLMPQKVCPEDGEKMSGAWKFCPWHGKALVDAKPAP